MGEQVVLALGSWQTLHAELFSTIAAMTKQSQINSQNEYE